jgi:hypothetical protein
MTAPLYASAIYLFLNIKCIGNYVRGGASLLGPGRCACRFGYRDVL